MPDSMSIGQQTGFKFNAPFGLKNDITGQPLGMNPSDLNQFNTRWDLIGFATQNGFVDALGNPITVDLNDKNIKMKMNPGTGKMEVYRFARPMLDVKNQITIPTGTETNANTTTTNASTEQVNTGMRLPKEFLDDYIKAIQGDSSPVKYKTTKPVDPLGSSLANIVQGFTEGAMTRVKKKVTGDIGKKDYIEGVVKPLGQATSGNENMYLNKQGELSGGTPSDYYDLTKRQQMIGAVQNALQLAQAKGMTPILIERWKAQAEAMAQNGDAGGLLNLLTEIEGAKKK